MNPGCHGLPDLRTGGLSDPTQLVQAFMRPKEAGIARFLGDRMNLGHRQPFTWMLGLAHARPDACEDAQL
jgi:hypothetical protein